MPLRAPKTLRPGRDPSDAPCRHRVAGVHIAVSSCLRKPDESRSGPPPSPLRLISKAFRDRLCRPGPSVAFGGTTGKMIMLDLSSPGGLPAGRRTLQHADHSPELIEPDDAVAQHESLEIAREIPGRRPDQEGLPSAAKVRGDHARSSPRPRTKPRAARGSRKRAWRSLSRSSSSDRQAASVSRVDRIDRDDPQPSSGMRRRPRFTRREARPPHASRARPTGRA